jgi:branched-chain amino acid transport system substrate-binding protein
MTVKKWNKEGGINVGGKRYKIEIVEDDNKYQGPVARQVAEKQCFQDRVHTVFSVGSTPAVAAGPIYNENKVIFFVTGSATSKMIGKDKPYVFSFLEGREVCNLAFWRWIKRKLGVKTVVEIFPNDDAGRGGVKINEEEVYPRLGIKSLAQIPVEREDMDFSAAITKAMTLNPDAINFSGSPGQTALFAKQSTELGYKGKRINEAIVDAEKVTEVAGKGGNGIYSIAMFGKGPLVTSELAVFIKEYKALKGSVDPIIDAYKMMIESWRAALEKAGTLDQEKVMKTLAGMKLHHVLGEAKLIGKELWGIDRQAIYPGPISEVRDGQNYSVHIIPTKELYQDYLSRLKK